MIAALGEINVSGAIIANGGPASDETGSGGSGGAIRLIAEKVGGTGLLSAINIPRQYYYGGIGRIRIETSSFDYALNMAPLTQPFAPGMPVLIWPKVEAPATRIVTVGKRSTPSDFQSNLGTLAGGAADVTLDSPGDIEIEVATENLPSTAKVIVKVTGLHGPSVDLTAGFIAQSGSKATWKAVWAKQDPSFHLGYSTMQVVARTQ